MDERTETPEDDRNGLRALGIDPDKVIRRALHDELRLRRFLAGVPVSHRMRSEPLADPVVLNRRLAEAVEELGPFAPTLRARLEDLRIDTAKPKKLVAIGLAARNFFGRWRGYSSDDAATDAMIVWLRAIGKQEDGPPSIAVAWLLENDPAFVRAPAPAPLTNAAIADRLDLDRDVVNRRLRKLNRRGTIQPRKAGRRKK